MSGFADRCVEAPASIRQLAGPDAVTPVWVNGEGGITFRIGDGPSRRFVKWNPHESSLSLTDEAVRLRWASVYLDVPQVLDQGQDPDGSWLLTAGLPGESAISDRWKAEPEIAVRAAGSGLRALHNGLPVDSWPFDWSAQTRLSTARQEGLDTRRIDQLSERVPAIDRLVVCHGDACVPNTLIGEDGSCVGHTDLGMLGVADRWADIAVATWSTEWNYGPGWENLFLSAYGVRPDHRRTRFYRDLWDVASPV